MGVSEKYEEEHSTKAGGTEGAVPARAESESAGSCRHTDMGLPQAVVPEQGQHHAG